MKGTFVKQIQRSLVAVLLVVGALAFSTTRANAQVTNIGHNWLTESEALTALDGAIATFALDQGAYPQGSTPWINATNHIEYYKMIMGSIESGTSVPAAVINNTIAGYNPNPAAVDAVVNTLSPAQMNLLRNDAMDLLTQ